MPQLAFGFCALAFGDALGAGLVDVALGYANDCALISENHTMPDAVEPFARIRLMRAAAHSERGEYALALASLEAVIEDTRYAPSCGSRLFHRVGPRSKRRRPRDASRDAAVGLVLRGEETTLTFPGDDAALRAYVADAASGPGLTPWRLGHAAETLRRKVARAKRAAEARRKALSRAFEVVVGSDTGAALRL